MTVGLRINELVGRALLTVLLVLVLVVPLLHLANPWETRGVKPLLVEIAALALLGLALAQAQVRCESRAVWAFLRTGPNLPLILLVIYGGVSWCRSPVPGMSAVEWWRLASGAALYLVVGHALSRREQILSLLDVLTSVAILASVLGFLSIGQTEETRITGTFGNSQLLAGFLLLLLPLLTAVWFSRVGPVRKIGAQVGTLLTVCALVQTQTRTSWLSAAVALSSLVLLALCLAPAQNRARRTGAHAIPALAVVVAALALFMLNSTVLPTLQVRAATLADPVNDGSIQWRLQLWRAAGTLIRWRPLFGWGIGTFPHYYALVRPSRRSPCLAAEIGPTLSSQAHNEYLQVAAELGLVGLGLYVWMLGAFFVHGIVALAKQKPGLRRLVLMGCLSAVAGQAVDALSNPAWRFAEVSFLFWLVMGLGTAVARVPCRPEESGSERRGVSPRPLRRIGWQALVLAITALTISTAWTAPRAANCPVPRHDEQGSVTVRILRQSAAHDFQPLPESERATKLAPGQCVRYVVRFNERDVSRCYDVDVEPGHDADLGIRDRRGGSASGEPLFCLPADACAGNKRAENPRRLCMLISPLGTQQPVEPKPVVSITCDPSSALVTAQK